MYNILFRPVNTLINIKDSTNKALKRLGIYVLRDLLFYKPYSYTISDTSSDLNNLSDNKLIQAKVKIGEVEKPRNRKGPTKIHVYNDSGDLTLVFFNKIPPFIFNKLKIGELVTISGKVQYFNSGYQITHPDFIFNKEAENSVQPVYHLTYGLMNKQLYNYILSALKLFESHVKVVISLKENVSQGSNILTQEHEYMNSLLSNIKSLHLLGLKDSSSYIEKIINQTEKQLAAKELFANQVALSTLRREQKQKYRPGFQGQ
ncbi:MAG: hypothetical protein DGJ47_000217 [Rickettsiaceae bacterium]